MKYTTRMGILCSRAISVQHALVSGSAFVLSGRLHVVSAPQDLCLMLIPESYQPCVHDDRGRGVHGLDNGIAPDELSIMAAVSNRKQREL